MKQLMNAILMIFIFSANVALTTQEIFTINTHMANINITSIKPHHIEAVKKIIVHSAFELQLIETSSIQQLEEEFKKAHEIDDLDAIDAVYLNNKGTFLVMLDNREVIGMGAIKYVNDETCELKRLFFDKTYRGKGLGTLMVTHLLEFSTKFGYKKVRLDVYNTLTQKDAVALYKKFGFYETEPYRECRAQLFMEKIIESNNN